jgi:beta-galactosidase
MPHLTSSAAPVTYDARSFRLHGQRTLLISGEVHYSRSPRALWPALLDRSVACGLTCIASYIFWNIHEPARDVYDFSGDRDLGYFLELCAERGLAVILRAGPYCCAEWNYGGYPPYLRDEPGIVIRTWNPPYLQRVEKYFRHLVAEIRPHLITQGGPVALVQVENEYANVAARYGEDGQRYLAWMAALARELGLDVPLIMCEGGAEGVIDTVNGFSITDERLATFRAQHPDLPLLWTELWPAWYDTWGFGHHRRDPRNIAGHLLRYLCRGGSGWNYYMWHGGTNFGRTSMYLQTTSYDFDAPLDEYGRISLKGAYLARLHHALLAHTATLLEGERQTVVHADAEVTTWRLGAQSLTVTLTGERARVADPHGVVLFDTEADYAAVQTAVSLPAWKPLTTVTTWAAYSEPFPAARQDGLVAPQPLEALSLTHDQSDYCWYSTTLTRAAAGPVTVEITAGGDFFYLSLNERLVAHSQPPFRENRGPTSPDDGSPAANELELLVRDGFRHSFTFTASAGPQRLVLLAIALGLVKGDWQIAGPMQTERKGLWGPVLVEGEELTGWTMHPGLLGERASLTAWAPPASPPAPCTWYRATITLPAVPADADVRLDASGLGKGMLFLNGHALGRYWLIPGEGYGADEGWADLARDGLSVAPAGVPTQRYYHLPRPWLQTVNELVLFEEQAIAPVNVRLEIRHHAS